jgi:hypothetical protein
LTAPETTPTDLDDPDPDLDTPSNTVPPRKPTPASILPTTAVACRAILPKHLLARDGGIELAGKLPVHRTSFVFQFDATWRYAHMTITMMMGISPFGQLGLWAPSSGARDVFTSLACVKLYVFRYAHMPMLERIQGPNVQKGGVFIATFQVAPAVPADAFGRQVLAVEGLEGQRLVYRYGDYNYFI